MIFRVEHKKNYTVINNETLRNPQLSWKARGLLAFFLSHSDGYQIRVDNLWSFSKPDGSYSITSGIKELKNAGYMTFEKKQHPVTKAWMAGEWVVSEKPDPQKPYVRDSLSQGNRVLSKKDKEERKTKKKERNIKLGKTHFFDPLDLPIHLGKDPNVVAAWIRYVQNRKERHHQITPTAFKMLVKKMMTHSVDEIVKALDLSSERGYTGVFFNEDKQYPQTRFHLQSKTSEDKDWNG